MISVLGRYANQISVFGEYYNEINAESLYWLCTLYIFNVSVGNESLLAVFTPGFHPPHVILLRETSEYITCNTRNKYRITNKIDCQAVFCVIGSLLCFLYFCPQVQHQYTLVSTIFKFKCQLYSFTIMSDFLFCKQ